MAVRPWDDGRTWAWRTDELDFIKLANNDVLIAAISVIIDQQSQPNFRHVYT